MNALYSLPEFVRKFDIRDVMGASVACKRFDADILREQRGKSMCSNFYMIITLLDGTLDIRFKGGLFSLGKRYILVLPPHCSVGLVECSSDVLVTVVMMEDNFYKTVLNIGEEDYRMAKCHLRDSYFFYPDESKINDLEDLYGQVCRTMRSPHLYGGAILKSLIHAYMLIIAEMQYGNTVRTHDIKHKENIFKIFIHLATMNFRKERTVTFYADKMNITTTYLSRVVKEMSGNTVLGWLSVFLYNEACKLLKTTDMTVTEISDDLSFSDLPAFTNFFKAKAGMPPLSYRKNGV